MAYAQRKSTKPYPGYDETGSHVDEQPLARVKPEAEEFARKHKGVINLFNPQKENIAQAPPPEPRCPSAAARNNYEQGRKGNVGAILCGTTTSRVDYAVMPRVKPEAATAAEVHKGGQTAALFSQYGKLPASARKHPNVKSEGEVSASLDLGGRIKNILHKPSAIPESPKPNPRVTSDGGDNAQLDRGGRMLKIVNKYNTSTGTDRGAPRVKPEASENAHLDSGHRTSSLLNRYGKLPVESTAEPRVTTQGQDYANLDKGGRMNRLMHEGSKARASPRPPLRATSASARRNIKNNRGQIAQIFASTSGKMIVPSVGVRG